MRFLLVTALLLAFGSAGSSANDLHRLAMMQSLHPERKATAMAYFRLPLQNGPSTRSQPRLGFAVTAPQPGYWGRHRPLSSAMPVLDFGIGGHGGAPAWTASLSVGSTPAWSSDPRTMDEIRASRLFGDSGATWIMVGAATAALFVGLASVIEEDVPAASGTGD